MHLCYLLHSLDCNTIHEGGGGGVIIMPCKTPGINKHVRLGQHY